MNPSLIAELTRRDLTERYAGSALGTAWSLIWPLVMILIYTVVFSQVMGARLAGSDSAFGYGIYLVAGILPWTAFANTVSRVSTVYVDRAYILTKVRLPLGRLPLFVVLAETVILGIAFGLFLVFLAVTGSLPGWQLLWVPMLFALVQLFAYALGLFVAMFNVFLRDLKELVGVVLQLWFWLTPIVYVTEILPDWVKALIQYNPAFLFVDAFHQVFVYHRAPDPMGLLALALLGLGLLALDRWLLGRLERDIRDLL